jgi:2-amino-4-hydroxy-6-hydroxymethyldihydropteridine diphosphokinase
MIIIALGSNQCGVWGSPKHALQTAIDELANTGIGILSASAIYCTRAQGDIAQPNFLNAAAIITTPMAAAALLTKLKRIEAQAGRSHKKDMRFQQNRWLPRTLDLDIIAYHNLICNWDAYRPKIGRRVLLPHARAHERAFVMRPIAEIAPYWHHPVFGLTAAEFLKSPKVLATGSILSRGEPLKIPGPR